MAMQQLPAKDQAVFRSIVKFYETKQYKKGVKAADSILKKHPEHGETLCMKGLTLSYLDKKEEAYELTRKGLKHDLRSHVCWHVYGLLYRQDRDYREAVKCYRQALRIDPDNIQILRDLSLLQIHCRDVTGFAETRRKLLQVKPGHRLNWVGYAIAEHLCQSYEFAWTCIDNYEKTFKDDGDTPYENSELFMYKATIMEEAGKLEEALKCLTDHEKQIVDKLGMLEMKGRLCMFLERYSEAADIFQRLLKLNPENHNYVLALMANQERFHRFWPALPKPATETGAGPLPSTINSFPQSVHPEGTPVFGWLPPKHAQGPRKRVAIGRRQHKQKLESYEPLAPLTGEEEAAVDEFFDELSKEHPRSDALKRLPLYFLSGLRLKKRLDVYLRSRMRKGVPSMFRMLRPLYFQEGKGAVIESLLMQYNRFLEAEVPSFGPAPSDEALPDVSEYKVSEEEEEAPSCLLFCRMVTAEHFDFYGETHKALEYIDKAIEHTPTMVEIYACKARIYRHAGDLEESAKWFDTVRQMDLADRFLNTQCVRALLRVDNTQGGMEKALLFSKEPDSPEAANLHDMQCMWYESAVGRSYCRQRKPGKALKQFGETIKHFSDIAEDQFDFHNYCLRKSTLKAYVAMLRMQERLYSHKFFRRAAKDSIKIYLELFDMRLRGEGAEKGGENGKDGEAEMSAAEKKKLKHAQKRQKAKEEEKKAVSTPSGKPKKVDDDPDGEKLLEKDPMEEANKLVKQLVLFCDAAPASHVLTYEVFCRQGRWLHCLQAILRLFALSNGDPTNYKLISPLAHFCFQAKLEDGAVPAVVREVILGELAPVVAGEGAQPFKSVADMRSAANKVVDSVEQRLQTNKELAVVEVMNGLKCLKNAGRDSGKILGQWSPQGAVSLKECKKLLEYLEKEFGKESAELANFKKRCSEIFPLMVIR